MGLVAVVVVEAGPLPLGSSLVGIGRVIKMISKFWEASLPLEGSLDVTSGLVALGTTPLVVSSSLIATSVYFASLEGLLGEGRTSAGLSLLRSVSLEAISAWELGGTDARIAGGSRHSLLSKEQRQP